MLEILTPLKDYIGKHSPLELEMEQRCQQVLRLFWKCPRWAIIREFHLTPVQLRSCAQLPLCTQPTGSFLLTPTQIAQVHEHPQRIIAISKPAPP